MGLELPVLEVVVDGPVTGGGTLLLAGPLDTLEQVLLKDTLQLGLLQWVL